jgi:hypothetical protein
MVGRRIGNRPSPVKMKGGSTSRGGRGGVNAGPTRETASELLSLAAA